MRSLTYFLTLLAFTNVYGARILGLFPHTGKSHQMVFDPLLQRLAERGHHLTVASFFPLKHPPANYTNISFEGIATLGVETIDLNWYESLDILHGIPRVGRVVKQLTEFYPLAGMALNICVKAIDWPPLVEALKKEYDVVLVENFNSDCMLGLLHVYNIRAPIVALSSSNLMPWSSVRIGVADNPAYVPVLSTGFTPRMSFLDRMENSFLKIYHRLWFRYMVQFKEQAMIEKHYGVKIPDFETLGRNYSLMMVNTYHALNGPAPLVPGLLEVGGMHLDPTRKVIPELPALVFPNRYDLGTFKKRYTHSSKAGNTYAALWCCSCPRPAAVTYVNTACSFAACYIKKLKEVKNSYDKDWTKV